MENLFLIRLATENAMLVSVCASRGSVPREKGAWMAVFAQDVIGTVGGGHLEFQALAQARRWLDEANGAQMVRYPLGPALGQCCGGEVHLRFEPVGALDVQALRERLVVTRHPVAVFGAGHVGQALVRVLSPLPVAVTWVDSRDDIFPLQVSANVCCEWSDPVQMAVSSLAAGSRVLIMSFSHAQDLDVLDACLLRQRQRADLPYIGLIGSRTKWTIFQRRLQARGYSSAELAQVTCPVGIPGIASKAPEVIAVAVAAQILLTLPGERYDEVLHG